MILSDLHRQFASCWESGRFFSQRHPLQGLCTNTGNRWSRSSRCHHLYFRYWVLYNREKDSGPAQLQGWKETILYTNSEYTIDALMKHTKPYCHADFERNLADKLTKFGEEPSSVSSLSLLKWRFAYSKYSLIPNAAWHNKLSLVQPHCFTVFKQWSSAMPLKTITQKLPAD